MWLYTDEDLCFQLQQAAEKALKGFLIYKNIKPPRTHSLTFLLTKTKEVASFSYELNKAVELEDYAVQTRYPGDYSPVGKEEYKQALAISKMVVNWVQKEVKANP